MHNWLVTAKRRDGSVLVKFQSNREKLSYVLEECIAKLGEIRDEIPGDLIIDVQDLTSSSASDLIKTPFSLGGDGFIYYNPRG